MGMGGNTLFSTICDTMSIHYWVYSYLSNCTKYKYFVVRAVIQWWKSLVTLRVTSMGETRNNWKLHAKIFLSKLQNIIWRKNKSQSVSLHDLDKTVSSKAVNFSFACSYLKCRPTKLTTTQETQFALWQGSNALISTFSVKIILVSGMLPALKSCL